MSGEGHLIPARWPAEEMHILEPCPLCGTEMHDHGHCFSHPRPAQGDCVLRHYSFGKEQRALWNTRHQPQEREAVLEEHFPTGLRSTRHVLSATGEVFESPIQCDCHCGASFAGTDEQEVRQLWAAHAAALTTPAPTSEREAEITLGKAIAFEEAARLIEQRNPNEGGRLDAAAIRALKPDPLIAPAVSTDEIVAVFSENLPDQAVRLGVHHNGTESPGQWRDRVRKAAILSRMRGEG